MKSDYWFKKKVHGYGWYPKNWKGWISTVVFAVLVIILGVTISKPIIFVSCLIAALVVFILFVKKHGETLK